MSAYASSRTKASPMTRSKGHDPSNIKAANAARREISRMKIPEFLDALATLGIMRRACDEIGIDSRTVAQWIIADPSLADQIRAAQVVGKGRRIDYLESMLYEHIDAKNLTAVIFALKREDPSYRESYHVNSTSQPTNYVIDLGLPDDPSPVADVTPAQILE